jgi:hypothetical protein
MTDTPDLKHTVDLGKMAVDDACLEAVNKIKKKHRLTDAEFGQVALVAFLQVYYDSRSKVDIDLSNPRKTVVDISFDTGAIYRG